MGNIFGLGAKADIWGNKRPTKQVRRETIAMNRRRGREGEETAKMQLALRGYEVSRTGRGSDFRVRKRHPITGKVVESKLVEVKTGNAKLSRLQNRTKRRQSNYKVMRTQTWF